MPPAELIGSLFTWRPVVTALFMLVVAAACGAVLAQLAAPRHRAASRTLDKLLIALLGQRHPAAARAAIRSLERLADRPHAAPSDRFEVLRAADGTYGFVFQPAAGPILIERSGFQSRSAATTACEALQAALRAAPVVQIGAE